MASLLITLGANVNAQLMRTKRTPLMISLFHNNLHISALLLDKGADTSLKDCNGLTCMHYAIDSGNLETVRFVVEHGIDINVADNKGWTGLLRAVVMENNDEIVKYLLQNGADINVKDTNGFDYYKHCEISGSTTNLQDVESSCYRQIPVATEKNPTQIGSFHLQNANHGFSKTGDLGPVSVGQRKRKSENVKAEYS
ncbi:Ankyrin repeats (3 copies) [Popillia japonica]|uniref:Ankyrin repeats (3 copies) n=1 Tax=Popillia japonica TaxID=7064 RepID=A0AAW1KS68_POPJA